MLKIKKVYHILLALYPILSGYGFSAQLDFGTILIFGLGCIYFLKKRENVRLVSFRGYLLFFFVAVSFSLFFLKTFPTRLLLFSINLWIAIALVDVDLLKKYYFRTVTVCCAYFVLQEITYRLMGSRISGLTTLVPTIYGSFSEKYIAIQKIVPRSASFFLEPSYFAQFLFPYIVLKLFSTEKKNIRSAVLVSFVMLLTKSGSGALLLMIIWGFWFFCSNVKTSIKITIGISGTLVLLAMLFLGEGILNALTNRVSEVTSTTNTFKGDGETSGFIRFYRGYYLYADLPWFNKLFGSTKETISMAMLKSQFLWSRDSFMNGMQTLLIYHGLFVCVLYMRHLILLFKGHLKKKELILLVMGFIYLMLSESYYLCSRAFVTLLLIYGFIQVDLSAHAKKIKFFGKG